MARDSRQTAQMQSVLLIGVVVCLVVYCLLRNLGVVE